MNSFFTHISEARGDGTILACQRGTTPRVRETDLERRGLNELGPKPIY